MFCLRNWVNGADKLANDISEPLYTVITFIYRGIFQIVKLVHNVCSSEHSSIKDCLKV